MTKKIHPKFIAKTLISFFLLISLCQTPAKAAPDTFEININSQNEVVLDPSQRLVHPVTKGALGPWRDAEVWLTGSSEFMDPPFSGFVIASENGKRIIHALPKLDEPEAFFSIAVKSVLFKKIRGNQLPSLIIIYVSAKIGPRQPITNQSAVFDWDGKAFIRNPGLEARLSGAKNSKEALKRLARLNGDQ